MTKTADVTAPAAPVAAPWATPAAIAAPSPESAAPAAPAADTVVTKVEAAVESAVAKVEAEVVDMVTVTVPRAFKLMLDHFHTKDFKAGIQEMERSHAEHWYAKASGVEIYEPKAPAAE